RRAKVIHATGELEASTKLKEAAEMLNQAPNALQLRYMQTLTEITTDKTSTIVFPMPINLVEAVNDIAKAINKESGDKEKG
ncbi:slipin family protein, partial [Vibrio sp. 10N.222.49.C9]